MAWNIHWQCCFQSLYGIQYAVNIYEKDYSGEIVQLEPSANPFSTEEDSEDDIFSPIRRQYGILSLIDNDNTILEEILPKNNTEKFVRLVTGSYSNGKFTQDPGDESVKWQGFLCAEAYTQPWCDMNATIELPVKSVLASLEDIQIEDDVISGESLIAGIFIKAFENLDVSFSSVNIISDITNVYEYFWRIFIQCANFFDVEEICNEGDVVEQIVGYSYYDIIKSIMKLYGMTLREEGNVLYIANYEKLTGNLRVANFQWSEMGNILDGSATRFYVKDIEHEDLLQTFDFMGTDNFVCYNQGARKVKIVVDVSKKLSINLHLPQTTEDSTELVEVKEIWKGKVFAQPHANRAGKESFEYYEYQQDGMSKSIRVGSSTYQKCLANSVIYRPLFDPQYSSKDNLHTGAFPCRWYYQKETTDTPSMKNGMFFNQQYVSDAVNSFNPDYCYSIGTEQEYQLSDGYLNIQMLCHNFMRGKLSADKDKLYFGEFTTAWATKPQTTLYFILTFGDKEWNGTEWVTHLGVHNKFTIDFDGASIKSNKTTEMLVEETSGYFIPIDQKISGKIRLYILNLSACNTELGLMDAHCRIISDLSVEFYPNINLVESHRDKNTYMKIITQSGFSGEKEINLNIGTYNNNTQSTAFIKNDPEEYTEKLSYYTSGINNVLLRPEIHLLNRMEDYYKEVRRTFQGVFRIGKELMKTKYLYINKYFFGIKKETRWRDDVQDVKFIEVL